MSSKTRKIILTVLSVYICFIFIQSLFFKFAGAPEPTHIFSTLDDWARNSLGLGGLFFPSGLGAIFGGAIFNATAIGIAELICSALLLIGLIAGAAKLHMLGALGAMATMTGAIFFHLFTPLGVVVLDDSGLLFINACLVWCAAAAILYLRTRATA
ncbi:MAG: hypothetical protein AAF684_10935 [Pseudomonadota bacterium]